MKIQDLKATVISVPLKSDLTSVRSSGPQDRLRTRVVKVETDEGVTGEVYACNSANGMSIPFREMRQLVVGACKELAVGEDPFAIERVWERLSQVSARTENKEAAMRAISAVDIALWDVIGKVSNMPLHKLLGGYKEELPAMGDGANWEERDPESMTEFMVRQKEMGYAGTKFNVGKAPVEAGIKRIEAIRRAAGDDFLLACDAGQAWTPEEAIKFAKGVEEYDIAWFEEPVRYDDVEGMRRVREATTIPVTAGQSELNGFGCLKLMRGGAVDYLNVESCKAGALPSGAVSPPPPSCSGCEWSTTRSPRYRSTSCPRCPTPSAPSSSRTRNATPSGTTCIWDIPR